VIGTIKVVAYVNDGEEEDPKEVRNQGTGALQRKRKVMKGLTIGE